MHALPDLQKRFRDALLDDDVSAVEADIVDDGLTPAARIAIYRHHVLTSLIDVLAGVYPVVRRLVDPRFFAYAADVFIRQEPPASPCLSEYGASFADFLGAFPPCRDLPWLADVARLEWALSRSAGAADAVPLDARMLTGLSAEESAALRLAFDPSVAYLRSRWPVDAIWRAHQAEGTPAEVDVSTGAIELEIRRLDDDVVLRRLDAVAGAFRRSLAAGYPIAAAADAALSIDGGFDLAAELASLLDEGIVTGFTLSIS
jgi:hypothetical protein